MRGSRTVHLNRKLTLEEMERTPDGAGGFHDTWAVLGTVWAEVRAGTGREKREEFAHISEVPYRITVRAAPEGAPSRPYPEQRFRDGARVFAITAVADTVGDARYLTCFTKEEVVK